MRETIAVTLTLAAIVAAPAAGHLYLRIRRRRP